MNENDLIPTLIVGACFVAVYVVFVWGVGKKAASYGRQQSDWSIVALLISPVIAYLILLIAGPKAKLVGE